MLLQKIDEVKNYLNLYLANKFINVNSALYLFLVFLLKNMVEEFNFVLTIGD